MEVVYVSKPFSTFNENQTQDHYAGKLVLNLLSYVLGLLQSASDGCDVKMAKSDEMYVLLHCCFTSTVNI